MARDVVWRALTEPEAIDGGTRLRLDHRGFTGVGGTILSFMHTGGWRSSSPGN